MAVPADRPPTRRHLATAMGAMLPWSWFLVRDLSPVLEWVAILLPVLVGAVLVVLVTVAVALHRTSVLVMAGSLAVMGMCAVVAPWTPLGSGPPRDGTRLLAANVFGDNKQQEALVHDLLAANADVLVASELSSPQQNYVADSLDERYPYRFGAEHDEVRVWSRFPLQESELPPDLAGLNGAAVRVDASSGPFLLYALHLYPPAHRALGDRLTVHQQDRLVRRLVAELDSGQLPVAVAGDLNLTDRGAAFRRLSENRHDAMRSTWAGPTSFRRRNRPLLLRIDHVLVPAEWCAADARRVGLRGSDHRGVAATIGPCSDAG